MALYDNLKNLIAGATLYADTPLGTINAFGGSTAPEGWLLCQGQAISRTTYEDLFAVIGTAFGAGDGSTTFNVPDLRGEFLRGAGTNSHTDQGSGGDVGFHQDATVQGLAYSIVDSTTGWLVNTGTDVNINFDHIESGVLGQIISSTTKQSATVPNAKFTARPTNTSVNYMIKAKQSGIPQDLLSNLEEMLNDRNILSWGD